jgi:hypothetical protein
LLEELDPTPMVVAAAALDREAPSTEYAEDDVTRLHL